MICHKNRSVHTKLKKKETNKKTKQKKKQARTLMLLDRQLTVSEYEQIKHYFASKMALNLVKTTIKQ